MQAARKVINFRWERFKHNVYKAINLIREFVINLFSKRKEVKGKTKKAADPSRKGRIRRF